MPTRNRYNDIADSDTGKGEKSPEVFLVNIDAGKKALAQEKAEYRDAVKRLVSVHKKYLAVKRKSDERFTSRKRSRLSRAEDDVRLAVNVAEEAERRAMNLLKKTEEECNALFDYYFKNGKQRLARKENNKFDRYYTKEENEIRSIGFPVKDIIESFSENAPNKSAQPATGEPITNQRSQRIPHYHSEHSNGYPPAYGYSPEMPHYPPYPPRYYDPYAYRQSVNISPINLDVTGIVEEAVKETMDRFIETIEKRLEAYENTVETPELEREIEQESAMPNEVVELVQKGGETVEKISELVSRLERLLASVTEIDRAINDMQRTALRDMQGLQVKQKLVNQEQDALVEEQALAHQRQAIVAENQKNLNEELSSLLESVDLLVKTQAENEAALKAALVAQRSTSQSTVKSLDLQKELSSRQLELALAVREALSAQKQAEKSLKGPTPRKKNNQSIEKSEVALTENASSELSDPVLIQQTAEAEPVITEAEAELVAVEAEAELVTVEAEAEFVTVEAEAESVTVEAEAELVIAEAESVTVEAELESVVIESEETANEEQSSALQ